MNTLPGMKNDVGYGSAVAGLQDWRLALGDEDDADDDDERPTGGDVKAILGFDPATGE